MPRPAGISTRSSASLLLSRVSAENDPPCSICGRGLIAPCFIRVARIDSFSIESLSKLIPRQKVPPFHLQYPTRKETMNHKIVIPALALVLSACASRKPLTATDGKKGLEVPSLTSPEVRRIWVPEKIEGNKFIEGHYMYVIDKPSVWSR